ncbi:hypothetical protein A1O3_00010 [Capronia epimyces CBS 606.96]|uniref:Uncharacterized protein n=1 Tax=Capronia epimyces CBS 606.96 TaxID=1182542 RepID=W9YF13_9EURO|nr:uncharacterized protein A1O3_00010 [Capronia epimyces CBS 606.96]EXJ91462.1 hypothetical protein A1O3_00010 [Capronia epimyces CBS 606.96]
MYCLRSYLPLLLLPLPLSLSPVHLILLLVLTYVLNRPCIYCSFLLIILFASSCHWSNRCFVDLSQHGEETTSIASWFIPRLYTASDNIGIERQANGTSEVADFLVDVTRSTVYGIAHALKDSTTSLINNARQSVPPTSALPPSPGGEAGIGAHWLRYLLGRTEWTLPCVGVKVVL